MKTIAILGMLVLVAASAQIQSREKWNWTLPASPVAKGAGPQTYRFTCDYYYLDTKGNPGRRERVSALYLRDLPEDRVRWSGVEIAESSGSSGNFGPARKCDFMEGFSYARASLKDMLDPGFFHGFPPTAMFERNLVLAVSSIYGIDLLQDNVIACRQRLLEMADEKYTALYKSKAKAGVRRTLRFILERNIIWGDALTLKTVEEPVQPIIFSEWSPVKGSLIKRRDFAFRELVEQASMRELPLFSDLGEETFIPTPVAEYPPVHFLKIGEVNV